ncbi:retinoic acid receptor beta isoform X2 [Folsomia candida]|uniref:retinoic acid receptor beta isoform X2 n=1 Tax=Folsomia candida TaxID=158441 RepID=UPI000B8F0757|nr:retinoic acid receptor beta isoform X2 [Folsomia candida]
MFGGGEVIKFTKTKASPKPNGNGVYHHHDDDYDEDDHDDHDHTPSYPLPPPEYHHHHRQFQDHPYLFEQVMNGREDSNYGGRRPHPHAVFYPGMESDHSSEGGNGHQHHPLGHNNLTNSASPTTEMASSFIRRTSEGSSGTSTSPPSGRAGANQYQNHHNSRNSKTAKICEVCGDIAKSLHFGGLSCDSCKAFFRRSVHKDAHLQFSCGYDNSCHISKQTRKSCQKCRFEKCIRIGMEKKWVMSEEERKLLNYQREVKKINKSQAQHQQPQQGGSPVNGVGGGTSPSESSSEQSSSNIHHDSDPETPTEYIPNVDEMLNYMSAEEQRNIREICEYYRIAYDKIPYNVPKTTEGLRNTLQVIGMFTTILRRFAFFSKLVPEFRDLNREDQGNLLKASVLEMVMLRGALSFDIENHRWPNTNLEFLKNCPQLRVQDMQNLVSPELFEMHMSFIKRIQNLKVDEPTVMLLLLIVMFYPERSELEDVAKVNKAQEKYCELLSKYVNWRYGKEGKKLYPKLLTQLSNLRQLNDLHTEYHLNLAEKEVNVIRQDLTQLHLNPYPQWKIVTTENSPATTAPHSPQFPPLHPTADEASPPSFHPPQVGEYSLPLSHPQQQTPTTPPGSSNIGPIRSSHHNHRIHSRMREAFLRRIPHLIDDPFAPLMTPEDMATMGQQFSGLASHIAQQPVAAQAPQPERAPFDPWQPRHSQQETANRSQQQAFAAPPNLAQFSQGGFDLDKMPQGIQSIVESLNPETLARLRSMFFAGAFNGVAPSATSTGGDGAPPGAASGLGLGGGGGAITPGLFANLATAEGQGGNNLANLIADFTAQNREMRPN